MYVYFLLSVKVAVGRFILGKRVKIQERPSAQGNPVYLLKGFLHKILPKIHQPLWHSDSSHSCSANLWSTELQVANLQPKSRHLSKQSAVVVTFGPIMSTYPSLHVYSIIRDQEISYFL